MFDSISSIINKLKIPGAFGFTIKYNLCFKEGFAL
jgi:hypothetical protein